MDFFLTPEYIIASIVISIILYIDAVKGNNGDTTIKSDTKWYSHIGLFLVLIFIWPIAFIRRYVWRSYPH